MQRPEPRDEATRLPVLLAIGLGETAGILLAAGALLGLGGEVATRLTASVLLGRGALAPTLDLWGAITIALPVHVTLAALFAVLYRSLHAAMAPAARARSRLHATTGLLFGLAIYLVNVQLIGRAAYEWFLDAPQLRLAALHALLYGLPLGLMFAFASRERARIRLATAAAPRAPEEPAAAR